ncbi:MAG: hypothetical protein LBD36_03255 [Holosporales bacterium]|nr:hypothetical protein [Holosporales bacterium]
MSKSCSAILSLYSDVQNGYIALECRGIIYKRQCMWGDVTAQSKKLLPLLQELIEEATFDLRQVDSLLVVKGPTSFTTQRVISAIGLSIKLCAPQASSYFPSHFHVLAHSIRGKIEYGQEFLVLIESLKHGFYGVVFRNAQNKPKMISEPLFYNDNTGVEFLRKHSNYAFITDFAHNAYCYNFLVYTKANNRIEQCTDNLAKVQIDLYKCEMDPDDKFDYDDGAPFYLHTPMYEKVKSEPKIF